jgi:hypothetical protein
MRKENSGRISPNFYYFSMSAGWSIARRFAGLLTLDYNHNTQLIIWRHSWNRMG